MELNSIGNGSAPAQADMQTVLAQMRKLRGAAQASTPIIDKLDQVGTTRDLQGVADPSKASFRDMMSDAMQSVNQLQKTSAQASADFVSGKEDDLVKVMVAGQKASVGFQAMVQVRNRMVTAYQDIMNMPI